MPCAPKMWWSDARYTFLELCKPQQHDFGRIFGRNVYRNGAKAYPIQIGAAAVSEFVYLEATKVPTDAHAVLGLRDVSRREL